MYWEFGVMVGERFSFFPCFFWFIELYSHFLMVSGRSAFLPLTDPPRAEGVPLTVRWWECDLICPCVSTGQDLHQRLIATLVAVPVCSADPAFPVCEHQNRAFGGKNRKLLLVLDINWVLYFTS